MGIRTRTITSCDGPDCPVEVEGGPTRDEWLYLQVERWDRARFRPYRVCRVFCSKECGIAWIQVEGWKNVDADEVAYRLEVK